MHVSLLKVASMIEWGETFLFHCMSREFQLEQPKPSVICQHGNDRRICDAKVQSNETPDTPDWLTPLCAFGATASVA